MSGDPPLSPEPSSAESGTDEAELGALRREIVSLRTQLESAEGRLADQRRSRLGLAARVVRAAVQDPTRRRSLGRDLAHALLDRSIAEAVPRAVSAGVALPQFDPPAGPVARPDLTVAAILDPFSEIAFRYEWNQVTFGPDDWLAALNARRPSMLFVESAWNGNDGRWRLHMTGSASPSDELRSLVGWFRDRGIPTVFWNKEDPPNYDRFVATAALFDHVFTVDADCIAAYRRDLGHDRVAFLPFAAQPRIHNPIQRGAGRVYDVAFAGSYFAEKHPERRVQMEYVLGPARDFGLHIYSRLQNVDRRYQFPRRYEKHIVGSLRYDQILATYASYKVFLNVNSVTSSPTMCARRLFELSAAQTPVVTGPAASVERFFGDDVTVISNADETRAELSTLLRHDELRDRRGLRAHRRVFDEHLYGHRVNTVLQAVGLPASASSQTVSIVVPTNRPAQLDHVLGFVGRQLHPQIQLVLVLHGFDVAEPELVSRAKEVGIDELVVRFADAGLKLGGCMNLGLAAADGELVAKMDDDNWYGPHYLTDLIRAFDYTAAEVVGKWAHLVHLEGSGATLLRFPEAEHRYVKLVQGGTIVVRRSTATELRFDDLPRRVDTTFLHKVGAAGGSVYSADRYNFVSVRRADSAGHTWKVTEQQLLAGRTNLLFYGEPYTHAEV